MLSEGPAVRTELWRMIQYEKGLLNAYEILELFADLIRTGMLPHLKGDYTKAGRDYMRGGFISHVGVVDWEAVHTVWEEL